MNEAYFRSLISGKEKSVLSRVFLCLLRGFSVIYCIVVRIRNKMFDSAMRKSVKAGRPVISVGNLTTGGTGKTPLVIWICRYLAGKDKSCAILTRGYKAGKGKFTDEPAILAKACSNAKVIVNPSRKEGAAKAVEQYDSDVLVMDDGFQHRQLARDLDIVAVDATCPFGYDRILPAGLLREPISALKRAKAIVITRYDQADSAKTEVLEKKLASVNSDAVIARSVHKPIGAVAMKGVRISLEELKDKKIFAFCGIGNPNAFIDMLKEMGLNVADYKIFNDHHDYSNADLLDIYEQARYLDAEIILSTQKDWVKTALLSMKDDNLLFAYLDIQLEILQGKEPLESLIDQCL